MREALKTSSAGVDGRTRRKIDAMRRVQDVALDLFEARGYAEVSVEAIAEAAGVGPATVYRNFGGKERIVLWDEYDPLLLGSLGEALSEGPPLQAIQRALSRALADLYARDRDRILRRARLVAASPELRRANADNQEALRQGLTEVLLATRAARDPLEAAVFGGAIAATIEAAAIAWLAEDGVAPLTRHLAKAFRRLERLASGG
ncbi:MAG: TetR family transcriptional regulator [Nannocystaceae bacterium]